MNAGSFIVPDIGQRPDDDVVTFVLRLPGMIVSLRYRKRRLRTALRTWSRPRCWVPLWLVLALGLLNPAACLVHCAPPHAEMHAAFAATHSEFFGFLCSIAPSEASAAPAPAAPGAPSLTPDPSGVPRAVFACVLLGLWLLPLLHFRRRSRDGQRPELPGHAYVPLLPPPRSA